MKRKKPARVSIQMDTKDKHPSKLTKIVVAVIIIAVVVYAILFYQFPIGTAPITTICLPDSGFLCNHPVMNANGQLSFNFGEAMGAPIFNISMGCTAGTNSTGHPISNAMFEDIYNHTNMTTYGNLTSGQVIRISGIQCYGQNGRPFNNNSTGEPVGTQFNGYIWIKYWSNNGSVRPYNITLQVATVAVKVT